MARKVLGSSCSNICMEKPTRLASSLSVTETCHTSRTKIVLTPHTFIMLLRCCRDSKSLSHGKCVHSIIITCGLDHLIPIQNLLIEMYGSCGALEDATLLLFSMSFRNEFSWTYIIRAYAENGQCKESLTFFEQMKVEGMALPLNKFLCVSILSAWNSRMFYFDCQKLHTLFINSEVKRDVLVGSALLNAYKTCKHFKDAERTFHKILEKDVLLYNIIIGIYVQDGNEIEALHLFCRLQLEALIPDEVTLVNTLGACASKKALAGGRQMHARFLSSDLETDTTLCNALVSMYSKAGSLSDARETFTRMVKRNAVSWNSMIACHLREEQFKQAVAVFDEMQHHKVEPSKVTFITVLSACASPELLNEGKKLHSFVIDIGFESDVAIGNALVTMYGNCGSLKDACQVFNDLPERDIVSYRVMATMYARSSECINTELIDNMQSNEFLKKFSSSKKVVKCASQQLDFDRSGEESGVECVGNYEGAYGLGILQRVFHRTSMVDAVMWSNVIVAYLQFGYEEVALHMLDRIFRESVMPDKFVCASILSACATLGALSIGKFLHACVLCNVCEIDTTMGNALVNLYGKCGSLDDTQSIFNALPHHDVVSWTTIIEAHATHGKGETTFQFYQQMLFEGVFPDRVSLVSLLTACGHDGALLEGKQVHIVSREIFLDRDLVIENALISMYARWGMLQIAEEVFHNVPSRDVSTWNAMITGYAQAGQSKNALRLFLQMEEAVPPLYPDYNDPLGVEHYNNAIDLLCRSGRLDLAEGLIVRMPFQPTIASWTTLLGACKKQLDLNQAMRAANSSSELDPWNLAPYVLLSCIYSASDHAVDSAL